MGFVVDVILGMLGVIKVETDTKIAILKGVVVGVIIGSLVGLILGSLTGDSYAAVGAGVSVGIGSAAFTIGSIW